MRSGADNNYAYADTPATDAHRVSGRRNAEAPSPLVSIIDNLSDLDACADEWTALEQSHAAPHHLFQSHAWCTHWLRAQAILRRDGTRPCIVTVREGDRLVLVWPLEIRKSRLLTVAGWLGEPLTQYGDLIAADDAQRSRWIEAAWDKLTALHGVDVILLRHVRDDALACAVLSEDAVCLPEHMEALSLNLRDASEWAQIEKRLKSSAKRNRRRQRRRLEERGRITLVQETHSEAALDLARKAIAMKRQWIDERAIAYNPFNDDVYLEALWTMVAGKAPQVPCRVFAHELDGKFTAIDITFQFKQGYCIHILAMNPEFAAFGPGNILTEDVISTAFAEQAVVFDLMAPVARYKEELTNTRLPVRDYAKPLTQKGRLYAELYLSSLRPRLKILAEKLPPAARRLLARR